MDEFDAYDVVKELRDAQDSPHWQRDSYKYMCKVAADEIEHLRELVKEPLQVKKWKCPMGYVSCKENCGNYGCGN